MSHDFSLPDGALKKLSADITKWAAEHQIAVGAAEVAAGAGLIAWGVNNGVIEMGAQLLGVEMGESIEASSVGAASGGALGAFAGNILGSIGVAAMGGAIGIPALAVAGGAAAVLALAGYVAGDLIGNYQSIPLDPVAIAANGGLLLVGVGLMVDGCRRILGDDATKQAWSDFKDGVLHLQTLTASAAIDSIESLKAFTEKFKVAPDTLLDATKATAGIGIGVGLGAAAGSAAAVSSVTVLGSGTLGAVALSLGVVSAPVWPVVACVVAGAGVGYAAYKAISDKIKDS